MELDHGKGALIHRRWVDVHLTTVIRYTGAIRTDNPAKQGCS